MMTFRQTGRSGINTAADYFDTGHDWQTQQWQGVYRSDTQLMSHYFDSQSLVTQLKVKCSVWRRCHLFSRSKR